ncbi:hypothetical protein SCA6_007132 [Theobroma cacao]
MSSILAERGTKLVTVDCTSFEVVKGIICGSKNGKAFGGAVELILIPVKFKGPGGAGAGAVCAKAVEVKSRKRADRVRGMEETVAEAMICLCWRCECEGEPMGILWDKMWGVELCWN